MLITMPTRRGWCVSWYTGVTKTFRGRNGYEKVVRLQDTYESTSKEAVETKAKELRKQGFEIAYITECIF